MSNEYVLLPQLSADSLGAVTAYFEPSLVNVAEGQRFQFGRYGYFVTDLVDPTEGKRVFNRVTGMKDSWGK